MDDRRRDYASSDPRFNPEPSRGFATSERYRPTTITTSSAASAAPTYAAYYPEPNPSFPTAGLSTNFSQHNYESDPRQTYSPFGADLMYNVQSVSSQAQNAYNSPQQFRQPASALLDVGPTYFPNEPVSAPQQHASSASTVYHQQSPADRGSILPQAYAGIMGGMAQAVDLVHEAEFQQQQPQGREMEDAYITYQTALKQIFQNIIDGRLEEASQSLLQVSEWLLGHVGDLGLTMDETTLHADRIRLWGEFNTAWLSIFQKQRDMLESQSRDGQRIHHPQSLMPQNFINKMAKDLLRMCDAIEKYGLIDYQYGVAEEQIITAITECLDLQESLEGITTGADPGLGRAPP